MKQSLLFIFMVLTLLPSGGFAAFAQKEDATAAEREQWMTEMRQYKKAYFTRQLSLNKEQQQKFFPLYWEMEDKIGAVNDDARAMERRYEKADDASDTELNTATQVLFDAKTQEAAIEQDFLAKYRDILSPRQLFKLKGVERQFSRELMKHHQRLRKGKGEKK